MNYSSITLIVFIILCSPWPGLSIYCKNNEFRDVSIKSFCVRENGQTVNCRGNLYKVNKAYVVCETGYYSKENISLQILDCIDNRRWSEQPIKCYPECVESPEKDEIKLIENDNSKIPEWYAELIKKNPGKGNYTKFPGVILNAGIIVVVGEFFDFNIESITDYFVRIYNTRTEFTDHGISHIADRNEFYLVHLNCYKYIKFDRDVKPICQDSKAVEPYKQFIESILKEPVRDCKKCLADYNDLNIEVLCFKNEKNSKFSPIDCPPESDFILTRCRMGYQYTKPNDRDYLSYCQRRFWQHKDNECKLICGTINIDDEFALMDRIYHGDKIDIKSTPWHAGIFIKTSISSKSYEHVCGGTIIHSNIIITAAHCFYDRSHNTLNDASNYIAGVGKNLRNFDAIEKHGYYTNIKEINIAKNYHPNEIINDIAVVVLDEHLTFNNHIKPICLDFSHQYKLNDVEGYITGWGPNSKDQNPSDELWTAKLTTITNDECKQLVSPKFRSRITGDKFCAINENSSSSCQGDSGGGFYVKKNIGLGERYYLMGIISTGIDYMKHCSDGFIPQFTNIQIFHNLIKDIVLENRNIQFSKNYNQLFKLS